MRVAVHQPNYLPWLGFFKKMALCDAFILLDNVQYPRREFCNRTRVKSPQGAVWLTIPVIRGSINQQIREVKLFEPERNLVQQSKVLRHYYGQAPYYRLLATYLEPIFAEDWAELLPLNVALIKALADILGISTPLLFASGLGEPSGVKSERIIAICRQLGADTYLSGQGGRTYNDPGAFAAAGIKLVYQNFTPPEYPQGGEAFIPGLSVLNLIAYTGLASRRYLAEGSRG